ncbi:MAG: Mu transposase C-terminal domain-containing protein [Verrucomicrobia bacterium]|nr:Mu transposase C-terminal domain-containing protein [Verrucomicrobiota bacterium]
MNRKHARFALSGSVADKRREVNKAKRAPKLSKADFDLLVGEAVFKYSRDLDRAWAECFNHGKLSKEVLARYAANPGARLRAPNAIRRQVAPEIKRIWPWHIGPRSARLNGAYLQRDWSNTFAGEWYQSDDITLPVLYYVEDGQGWFTLTRGQFLPMIDVKSKRILDFVLIDAKSYTAAAIRSLNSRVCTRFGLPRAGWHFESGIWKKAKLLGGGAKCEPWNDVGETFAERLGLRMVHSLPGNARAKVIENVASRVQDLMEGEAGYVGRNEMVVKHERVQAAARDVEARRVHPAEAGFLSGDQWTTRLHEICESYNSKPQDSQVIGARMSPDDAWESCQLRNERGDVVGLTRLPEDLRFLLASHKEIVPVTRNGISLFGGKFRYLGEATGGLQGQTVIAWFDPDHPETLAITDLRGENLQTVPRNLPVDAYNGFIDSPDLTRASVGGVNAHNGYGRQRHSELRAKYFPPSRVILADPGSIEKGREMKLQRNRVMKNPRQALTGGETEINLEDRLARFRSGQNSAAVVKDFLK